MTIDINFVLRQVHGDLRRFDPDRPALSLEDGPTLTFGQLDAAVNACARGLDRRGVRAGARVALLMYNSLEYWIAYFALTRLGAIAVRPNFRLAKEELAYILNDSGTTLLIVDEELLGPVPELCATTPVEQVVVLGEDCRDYQSWAELLEESPSALQHPLPGADDGAMIMYTSGTTGRPKGVLWSHGTTMWWAAMQVIEWRLGPDSVTMVTGPAYHIGGLENYLLPTLLMGGHAVMSRSRGFDLDRALSTAAGMGVTDLLLFPTMLNQLVAQPRLVERDLGRLARIFTGGDALAPSVVSSLSRLLPKVDLVQVYGLTEGTPIAVCTAPGESFRRPTSTGRAYPLVEVSVRDDDGQAVPPGTTGEIWTRSPANSRGYWNKPEENARTFTDGWCHTGDLGVVDDGTLSIAGRKKDMIRSGGENISPAEIEDALLRHPAVVDAAVVGIPDPIYVEAVCAVVVTNGEPVSEAELIEHCRGLLASYKKPRQVVFVPELPRNPSQKIQKFRIRQMLVHAVSSRP